MSPMAGVFFDLTGIDIKVEALAFFWWWINT
jgi:hypothetical protein